MTDDAGRWNRVKQVFRHALERPSDRRPEFIQAVLRKDLANAARAGRRETRSLLAFREDARETWLGSWDTWWRDLRLAGRGLRRSPGFAAGAIFTLAVGLTGAIAVFAVIHGVLLRALPVPDETRLVVGWRASPELDARRWPFRATDLDLLRRESRLLAGVAGLGYHDPSRLSLIDRDVATFVNAARVTGEFFYVLGVRPLIGRTLTLKDDLTGAENVLVLNHRLWRSRYGGSHDVLGRRVIIDHQPFTIVGVMPPDVEYPRHVDVWMTVAAMQTTNPTFREAMRRELDLLARVRDGVSIQQASAELRSLGARLDAERLPGDPQSLIPVLDSYRNAVVGDVRLTLVALFAAVGLLLLVASANVANLLLLRGETRRAEFAVRAALGANRGRLVRQVLAESAVLGVAAGGVALTAAVWMLPILLRRVPNGLPRAETVHIDAGLAVSSVAIALAVVSVTSLVSMLARSHTDLVSGLRRASPGARSGGTRRGRRALVVWQVALAVTVVAAAGVLTRSLIRLQHVGETLDTDRLVYVPLDLPAARYADRARREQFIADLMARLDTAAPIVAATPVNITPFSGLGWDAPTFTAEGQSIDATNPTLNLEEIHPNYFKAFAVPLLQGRPFTVDDRQQTTPVAILSRDIAERTWPGDDPIGKRVKMGGPDSPDPWRTIVGIAAPTRYREIRESRATLYVPASQLLGAAHDLVVRTSAPLPLVADLVRAQAHAIDPDVRVMPVRPFSALLEEPLSRPRFTAMVISLFGATALALAGIGLYAVLASSVRQRRHEMGVRMALGATSRQIHRLVLAEGFGLVGVGAVLGLAVGAASAQLLRGLLFEVQPFDPMSLTVTASLLAAVAGLALYLPARQAGRVDPAKMLRAE